MVVATTWPKARGDPQWPVTSSSSRWSRELGVQRIRRPTRDQPVRTMDQSGRWLDWIAPDRIPLDLFEREKVSCFEITAREIGDEVTVQLDRRGYCRSD